MAIKIMNFERTTYQILLTFMKHSICWCELIEETHDPFTLRYHVVNASLSGTKITYKTISWENVKYSNIAI